MAKNKFIRIMYSVLLITIVATLFPASTISETENGLSDAHAYPVPWKPNDGKPETGTEEGGITFTNLSTQSVIRIYTISGELVMKHEYRGGGTWTWDVKTPNGEKVFSGVYIYYIENEKEHKSGKLIIIR